MFKKAQEVTLLRFELRMSAETPAEARDQIAAFLKFRADQEKAKRITTPSKREKAVYDDRAAFLISIADEIAAVRAKD